jgi:nitroreductase
VNRQPWRFVVLDDEELKARVAETVYAPDNVKGAKLAIALVVQGSPAFDAGRAAQNMMLAAWNDGVTSCPNGSADADRTSAALGLGDDEHVINVLSFGYPADGRTGDDRPAEEWLSRAKRKPFDEVVDRR